MSRDNDAGVTWLVQYLEPDGTPAVAARRGQGDAVRLAQTSSVYELAVHAIRGDASLHDTIEGRITRDTVDVSALEAEGRLLSPVSHPDPAHCLVTGTGLTHLGAAEARDAMHRRLSEASEVDMTDTLRMFRMGVEGGKPEQGAIGIQPEWFYKGDGDWIVAPGAPLPFPAFAERGGEEPEIVAIHIIGPDGTPWRLGFALANEFSDHVMERRNYLWLSHSKLRACSIGPELRLGSLPDEIEGTSRILREGAELWRGSFVTGETNMSHSLANLEHHHFKYPGFRRPGDVHIHFLGTATISFADGIKTLPGDVFEISSPAFGRPLRNRLEQQDFALPPIRSL